MKVYLLILAISVVSCASGSKKEKAPEMEKKVEAAKMEAKKEAKTAVKKEMKKKPEAKKWSDHVTCSWGENVRIIKKQKPENGGCEVLYTKEGVEDSIANAQNDIDYCQEIVDRIANKLTAAGFKCEDNK